MDEPIGKLCTTVAKFCKHLECSCSALVDFDEEEEDTYSESKNYDVAEDDPLLDESLSLKHFGISNANIASQAVDEPDYQPRIKSLEAIKGDRRGELNPNEDSRHVLQVSRDDYESLPKHMKSLVSWEDLLVAIEKMNSCIGTKKIKPDTFHQDEIESLGLGFKTRSYLLLLIKMNRLCAETIDGVICYRIL